MGALTRIGIAADRFLARVTRAAAEGQPRAGPWHLPVSGGWLSPGPPSYGDHWNFWQLGGDVVGRSSQSAMVEACTSSYAQTAAMCPGTHWRSLANGGRERVTNSALSRILKEPNAYQTFSDFIMNAVRSLYLDGNAYALALRNNRFEIEELHLMAPRQSRPQVSEQGDVFYTLAGNAVIDRQLNYDDRLDAPPIMVPARDVLHIRLHCFEHQTWPFPLVGDTPLSSAISDIAMAQDMKDQQDQFYKNQARPSAVLSTDLTLSRENVQELRDRWNEQAKGLHAGGVPILTSGLKVQPWSDKAARDLQVAELLKMTDDHIALVFRVPLALLGVAKAPVSSTEALMNQWIASGLGFCLNHIEEAFDKLFQLKGQPDEYTEFDTKALLRTQRKERMDTLVRGVQGGILAPNEARAEEDLPEVDFGDEPRVQQQVVPLSAAGAIGKPAAPKPGGATIPSAPPAPPAASQPAPTGLPTLREYLNVRNKLESELRIAADWFFERPAA